MDTVGHVVAATGKVVEDQSFFRGLQNVMSALEDPAGKGQQFLSETASGMVPFSGLDRLVSQQLDPTVRDPKGMYERIKSGLPVLSKDLPPKLDIFGEPEQRARGIFGSTAGALTPLDAELSRLHEKGLRNIGMAGKVLTAQDLKMPLGRAERAEYQKLRGNLLKMVLDKVIDTPEYKAQNDQEKIRDITEAVHQVENYARDQMTTRVIERRLGQQARTPAAPLPDLPRGII